MFWILILQFNSLDSAIKFLCDKKDLTFVDNCDIKHFFFSDGDHFFKCSVRDLALWHSQHQSNRSAFVYRFDYINSNNPWPSYMGSLHGYEIESIFGIPFNPKFNYSESDRKVSADVMHYFATFAKTG